MALTKKQKNMLADKAEWEGVDYCFIDYSDFSEIKDEEFRTKLEAWRKARKEFLSYIGIEE